jgi:hypothetical protein
MNAELWNRARAFFVIQDFRMKVDSRFRGNDRKVAIRMIYA